jgi:L,D-peptidoglycan transpeptidase YkuD (ErfK/YbiS/YcfS/YnhG family)
VLVAPRRAILVALSLLTLAACSSGGNHPAARSAAPSTPSSTSIPATSPSSTAATRSSRPAGTPRSTPRTPAATSSRPVPPPPPVTTTPRPPALPLAYGTGTATRVLTVVAPSTGSTTATLQAWQKSGSGWSRYGAAVLAHLGSAGLSSPTSEGRSATPMGSFTLTQAFGALANPGTGLPYFHTDAADWWISQAGSLYNTHQHCSSGCAFTQGAPNEHLAYETPYYNYAVVIDYNTRNSPTGVRAGAGSAFFLHVTDGGPTAGCVAIPQSTLVSIMRWLTPAAHPRILIGVG